MEPNQVQPRAWHQRCQPLHELHADTRHIPAVAATAQAMPNDGKRVMGAGFDRYLSKPLDVAAFDELLEGMLRATPAPD